MTCPVIHFEIILKKYIHVGRTINYKYSTTWLQKMNDSLLA